MTPVVHRIIFKGKKTEGIYFKLISTVITGSWNCRLRAVSFYVRDLRIHNFCYMWRLLEPISCKYQGMTVVFFFVFSSIVQLSMLKRQFIKNSLLLFLRVKMTL